MQLARYYEEAGMIDKQACPITGIVDCRERSCELHYMDAPLLTTQIVNLSDDERPVCRHHPELPSHYVSDCWVYLGMEREATADRDYLD